MVPTALLIEDNRAVNETLSAALNKSYNLISVGLGNEGLSLIKSETPELIILDLNLPDRSGLSICREARKIGVKAPILIVSGDSRLSTKLELFSAGADDYIVKPFSLGELEARLKALLRRLNTYKQMLSSPRTPSLILDRASESVSREGGEPISLRHKEYAILDYLIQNAGHCVSRSKLVSQVWKNNSKPWSNTIDVHVNSLRDKIDKPYPKPLISTVHGVGYRLENR